MKINTIISNAQKPSIYTKGNAIMWTDEHISKQLLQVHLNKQVDLASRKPETIESTCEWMLGKVPGEKLKILDLGCGPGLYTELFAKMGHQVTGVDFSKESIAYARKSAESNNLTIDYINANYLDLELEENAYDLIIMIFTDMGVLPPNERKQILGKAGSFLKTGGTFIFDVLNDRNIEQKVAPKNWEVAAQGFWKPNPYVALSESFLYEQEKVILYQHILLDEKENIDVYRFWTHFFSHAKLESMLAESKFSKFAFYDNVLPEGDLWNGNNVTFTVAVK